MTAPQLLSGYGWPSTGLGPSWAGVEGRSRWAFHEAGRSEGEQRGAGTGCKRWLGRCSQVAARALKGETGGPLSKSAELPASVAALVSAAAAAAAKQGASGGDSEEGSPAETPKEAAEEKPKQSKAASFRGWLRGRGGAAAEPEPEPEAGAKAEEVRADQLDAPGSPAASRGSPSLPPWA